MTILEFAKTYGLDVRKITQAIDNLKTIQAILDQAILDRSDEDKAEKGRKGGTTWTN